MGGVVTGEVVGGTVVEAGTVVDGGGGAVVGEPGLEVAVPAGPPAWRPLRVFS